MVERSEIKLKRRSLEKNKNGTEVSSTDRNTNRNRIKTID